MEANSEHHYDWSFQVVIMKLPIIALEGRLYEVMFLAVSPV